MYFQVLLSFLIFNVAQSRPLEEYYVNRGDSLSNQQVFYNNQPRSVYYYPKELNTPIFYPQLGMSPQYHDLVFNYVKDFAGTEPPAQVSTSNIFYNGNQYISQESTLTNTEDFKTPNENTANLETDQKILSADEVTKVRTTIKPGIKDYFLPSDLLSDTNQRNYQFHDPLSAIKMKQIKPEEQTTSLPPLKGVISNYVLLRGHSNPQNLLQFPGTIKENEANQQHNKRQIHDNSDGIVILAEPIQNTKMSEENEQPKEEEIEGNKEEEQQMEAQPGIAQSKPSAIALAGPGGVAQASPVGTALVGQGGLAVAAPSGTAVAGPAGQGALPIPTGNEKQKTTEKNEQTDAY